jgi:hypothetical protein
MPKRRDLPRYYDVTLPVIIAVPSKRQDPAQIGTTRYVSKRCIYFTTHSHLGARAELDLTMVLPVELTKGAEVLLRAIGEVACMAKRSTDRDQPVGIVAAIKQWKIVRNKTAMA